MRGAGPDRPSADPRRPQAGHAGRAVPHDPRVAPWSGTAHGVLQAVSTYDQHQATVRGSSRAERNNLKTITGEFGRLDRQSWHTLQPLLASA